VATGFSTRRGSVSNQRSTTYTTSVWAGASAILILLTLIFIRLVGDSLYETESQIQITDDHSQSAVICLAGGKGRIEAAFDLYASGVGNSLYIVGAGPKTTLQSLLRNIPPATFQKISVERRARISIEIQSRNTIENAYVVNRYLQQNPEIKKVVVLTSGYHMKRSLFILRQFAENPNVEYFSYVPPRESVQKSNWYTTAVGLQVTLQEAAKYQFARFLIPQLKFF
jgi:uncharacterized SAM-binding protein YcdF (DUF218 family)